ncbi:MAG: HEAT repeat domain-containing protein [candidate division Zixibacteria bacterium]|nr:HEAT repeat domain-containing protein [candidate division Zixibacteria bacterium]MBU1471356.1 HEAT repeat domain-containing protein [candidate division Zixibacteria bacterium]MBU2625036.1 HEAT repeat domain-containing protein [candidate division Zixibacteria bacterium]
MWISNRILPVLLILTVAAIASHAAASTIDDKVDDLFLKASSGEIRYQDIVQPSKDELIEMGSDAVPRLVTKLSSEDARERNTLVDIFRGIGALAVPALIEALETDNLYALRNALQCLGEIGERDATESLLRYFTDEHHSVRSAAVTAVGRCHDSSAVDPCVNLLSDSVESVRKSAAVALGRIEDARATGPLIRALDDVHFSVRMSAARSLTSIGSPACDALLNKCDSLSVMAKSLAFEVWANSAYRPAAEILLSETYSTDPHVRGFAVVALASVSDEKARDRIEKLSETETDLFVLSRLRAAMNLLESKAE